MTRIIFSLYLSVIISFSGNVGNSENIYKAPSSTSKLLIGMYAVQPNHLILARMKGFEVVHYYRFEESSNTDDELAVYLDNASQLGLKVMVGFERKNYRVSRTLKRVQRFKAHPALWAWYLIDEPKAPILEKVAKIASSVRIEDSAHPLTIASHQHSFATLADFVFAYAYPVFDQPYPKQDLSSFVQRIDQAAMDSVPFISLVPTFNWNHYYTFKNRRKSIRSPNAVEMRFMAFYGIIKGCRGVFFFSFQTLPNETELLESTVTPLVAELKLVRKFISGQQVKTDPYLSYSHAAAWRKNKQTIIVVANPSKARMNIPLHFDRWAFSELKSSLVIDGKVGLPLDPWGVRIITAK